jgi:hypothetical protein
MPIYEVTLRIEQGETQADDVVLSSKVESDSTDRKQIRELGIAEIKRANPGVNFMKGYHRSDVKIVG